MKKRNPGKSPSWPPTNDRGNPPDFPGPVLSLLVWVAFFHPSTAEAWRGLAMGNQICSQIPLRIIVARGNLYSGISNRRCMYISDHLLCRISTDPPRWPVKNFGKVSCRSQIERHTSHSSGTKEDLDFQRSHKLNWTPNRNRGWMEACAHAR